MILGAAVDGDPYHGFGGSFGGSGFLDGRGGGWPLGGRGSGALCGGRGDSLRGGCFILGGGEVGHPIFLCIVYFGCSILQKIGTTRQSSAE